MFPVTITSIFSSNNEFKRFNLFFQNTIDKYSIFYDGFTFTFNPFLIDLNSSIIELTGEVDNKGKADFLIESIRESGDVIFVLFSDGTLFQLYRMMDDENADQLLSIFKKDGLNSNAMTPLGITVYEAAIRRYESAVQCKIEMVS